ncbi:MAG TPA: hypothetical protein VHD90_11670 [Phototrophicaceae bacterium]|nr:hypothetical protein [Phototrophicaceae bacterium]
MPANIFAEEWRDCLRAHYTTVVRTNDHVTEKTLRTVMFEAGFSEEDLRQLYIQATAHVDDVADDFVPDMEFVEGKAEAPAETQAVIVPAITLPQEVFEAEIVEEAVTMDETADAEMDEVEDDPEDQDEADDSPPKAEPDATQLSLF